MNWRRSTSLLSALALSLILCGYRAGDTVQMSVIVPDPAGVATVPTTLRAYVYKGAVLVDSSAVYPSGVMEAYELAGVFTMKAYRWDYTLSASYTAGDVRNLAGWSGLLQVKVRAAIPGVGLDVLNPIPAFIPVNMGPDSLRVPTIQDYWSTVATTTQATINGDDYGATEVTLQGNPVEGARVWVTRTNSPGVHPSNLLGIDERSDVNGEFEIPVVISATSSDTFYLWAYFRGSYVKAGEVLTIP